MDAGDEKRGEGEHLLRQAPGRETRLCVQGAERWIEKRYTGGSTREAWRERLRGVTPRSPARREYDALVELERLGIPVPRALAFADDRRSSSVRMEYVPHVETLKDRMTSAPRAERFELGRRLLDLVLRLHGTGWYHRDLYLEHFLLRSEDGGLCLIDLGRARRDDETRERWFEKDLAALQHSAPDAVSPRDRLRFLSAYLSARGILDRATRRRRAAAIARRAARMARHAPRHGVSHELPTEVRT
jgi:tRNA A-37 threonylcarbamoyl transferase component Bud32